MKEKEILRVEGPYGSFYLREDSDKPMVLLASGTGFAPIKAVIEHMQFKGITRPATLYWGGRRPADLYMDDWVQAQAGRDAQPEVRAGHLQRPARRQLDRPHGLRAQGGAGRLSRLVAATRSTPAARPSWWTRRARNTARVAKLPPDEFHADAFTTEADKHKD